MIASGKYLLTKVKGNQPNLRRKLEGGASWRKPLGCAISQAHGHNRWEKRESTAFAAKAGLRHTSWEASIKTVLRLVRTVHKRDPKTGLLIKTSEMAFRVSSAEGIAPERWSV